MTMHDEPRACEWPDGCNQGAFHEVDTAPIGRPGRRWLCLRHAGRVWNARKQANREAGLCPCGAAVTPGRKMCERCRERAREDKARSRNLRRFAAQCGITLPRQAGRRRAFLRAYATAFRLCQKQARRAWNRRWHRARGNLLESVTAAVGVSWEGHVVTCEATVGIRGTEYVSGIPEQVGADTGR